MADAPRDFDLPEAVAAPKRRWSLSLVWLIPIVAVVIGGWLAVKAIQERGPTITITFKTAEGLEAGKTKIKYKNVDVGEVKQIALSAGALEVVVTAEMVKGTTPYLVEDTRFWVVRPRIGVGGVSGLGTLFSGAYIGVDIGKSSQARREFTGLEVPPVYTSDQPGRQFVLRGHDLGSLDPGDGVFFRRVEVGQVTAAELDKDGNGVTVKIFIHAPYDQYVTTNTRFWHASGIDVSLDATGVKVHTQSLATIILGGIAFQTPPSISASAPAENDTVFTLFSDRTEAMRLPDTTVKSWAVVFDESLRGLEPGAPVDFRGVLLGEVKEIGVQYNPVGKQIQMRVEVLIFRDRLISRMKMMAPEAKDPKAFVNTLVEHGLRAQLRTGNLLTGQLYIAMDFFPTAKPATIDWAKEPPELPTMPAGGLHELQAAIARFATKLDKVPVDQIGADLHQTLRQLQQTLQSADKLAKRLDAEVAPEARATLEEARRTLGTAERALKSDAPLQQDAREALRELSRTAQALRLLADYLERHPEALIRGKKEQKP
jgi:paraquat-inducible protein B